MNDALKELRAELKVAEGLEPADLVLRNIQILDVFTERFYSGSLFIKSGKIVAVDVKRHAQPLEEFDGNNLYAVPGFFDTHLHIDFTLLTPETLADAIVPWGTTTVIAEVLDFASITNTESLKMLFRNRDKLSYRIFFASPAKLVDMNVTEEVLNWNATIGLGEIFPAPHLNDEDLKKILSAKAKRKIITGHVRAENWEQLNVHSAAGLQDNHEATEYLEVFNQLRLGIKGMIRDGSTRQSLEKIITGIVKNQVPTDNLMFCTDDIYVNDLLNRGHINFTIRKAIEAGLEPIKAIQMATINAARHFRLDHVLGSLTPGRFADIVLLENLNDLTPIYVFKEGRLVAANGVLKQIVQNEHPELIVGKPQGLQDLTPSDLAMGEEGDSVLVQVIDLQSDSYEKFEERLPVQGGQVINDIERDILKASMIERYPEGNRQINHVFVRGFGLKDGALATLYTQHRHTITVVGTNDQDMCLAAKEVDKHPGALVVAARNRIEGVLPLPIAGLMSNLSAQEVGDKLDELHQVGRRLGCKLPSPFMTLWFLPMLY